MLKRLRIVSRWALIISHLETESGGTRTDGIPFIREMLIYARTCKQEVHAYSYIELVSSVQRAQTFRWHPEGGLTTLWTHA